MIQHIALVLEAADLCAQEKSVLIAMCNHTDASGKTFAGEERLRREAGMPRTTFQNWRAKLVKRGLVLSKRKGRKGGGRATSDTWVNLDALRAMRDPFFGQEHTDRAEDENPFSQVSSNGPVGGAEGGNGPAHGAFNGPAHGADVAPPTGPVTLNNPQSDPSACGVGSSSTSGGSELGSDAAVAAGAKTGYDPAAAIERDMLAARAVAAEKENAKAAEEEQRRNQPNRLPQVEYVGPGNGVNGSAWAPAGGVEPVKVPEQPAVPKRKRYDKPEEIPFPERFHLNSVMAQRAKAEYPHLHPDTEFAEFAAHARENGRTSANWMEAWHRWIARSERMRRERAERGGFQPRGRGAGRDLRMPDGTPVTYPDGSRPVGADAKAAQAGVALAQLRAMEEQQRASGVRSVMFGFGGESEGGLPALPPGE